MILSATANVTLGENKITKQTNNKKKTYKNTHNNLFHASSCVTWWVKRRKLQRLVGERYTFLTGSEHVNIETNWGVKGWVRGSKGLSLELRREIYRYACWHRHTCRYELAIASREREAGSVNSNSWGSGLCHLVKATERGTINFMALLGQLS